MSLAELGRYPNNMEAEIIRGRLEAGGIGAVCFDSGMNIADSAAFAIPVRVMVLREDLAAARSLLAEDVAL
jgi:hypothetical protein